MSGELYCVPEVVQVAVLHKSKVCILRGLLNRYDYVLLDPVMIIE
jgi:hypothetical protein